jgi:NADPH2 dehydrogenase
MSTAALFTPLKLGNNVLKHRVVLAPLTRFRAGLDGVPTEMHKEYYLQRVTDGGFMISEATFIARRAGHYPGSPGIYTAEQIAGWKSITDEIHAKGGVVFLQLIHGGRIGMPADNEGVQPVGPSAILVKELNFLGAPHELPRALEVDEIQEIVQQFRQAALNAIEAGFDGVEMHGANGYIIDQFASSSSNVRTDQYGGSVENRARFPLEIVNAVAGAIGPERTAIRFSPFADFQEVTDDTPYETFGYITKTLQERHPDLAYVHFIEPRNETDSLDPFRKIWKGTFVTAGGYTTDAQRVVDLAITDVKRVFDLAEKTGNLIAFGRLFIANPDLVERLKNEWATNAYDRSTFYGGGAKGYIDYPFHK